MSNDALLSFLTPGPERGGVILTDGTILELQNHADDPNEGFVADPQELLDRVWLKGLELAATWHTHPDATANLSVEDAETFVMWPDALHHIVGTDGVRTYQVKNGAVVNA